MDTKLTKILDSIKLGPQDEYQFGLRIVRIIEKSKALHDPKDNYQYLRDFLKEHIESSKYKIKFTDKYTPEIYHPNVAISDKYDIQTCQQIIEKLSGTRDKSKPNWR